jgi:hypothetical protein
MTLLPLKHMEKLELVHPFSFKLSPNEKSHAKIFIPIVLLLFFVIATILYTDWILSDFVSLLAEHSYVEMVQYGIHQMDPVVNGTGFVARFLRNLFSNFKFRLEIFNEDSTASCLPTPSLTNTEQYIDICKYFLLIVVLNCTEMYFLRFRRIICGYYYPSRDKKRTLFLYNERLKKRKAYMKYLSHRIRKYVWDKRMKTDLGLTEMHSLGLIEFLGLGSVAKYIDYIMSLFFKKKCIVCDEKEDKNFHMCTNSECKSLYCDNCWNECRQKCLACRPMHTSDDSDLSDDYVD